MRSRARALIALVLAVAVPLPALAQTHEIAQLGDAPLIGTIASTPELQADVSRYRGAFAVAAAEMGLTPHEFAVLVHRINTRRLSYVTIPRHLDAMSWASGNQVYVIHDVVIPANTNGWEIDVPEGNRELAMFIPQKCGNLSILRRSIPRLARVAPMRKHRKRVRVAAARVMAPHAAPAQTAAPAAVAPMAQGPANANQGPAVVLPQQAVPPPTTVAAVNTATPPSHHFRLWPLLLIPLIGFFFGNHNGGSGPIYSIVPTPLPSPGCGTAIVKR